MVKVSVLSHLLKKYFKENPGALFIVQFQILLVSWAFLLIKGDSAIANEVAVVAYYLLTMGVILQLVTFVRKKENKKVSE